MQIKELIRRTQDNLDYYINRKEDLINCLDGENKLTKDCMHFCYEEIVKADKNINYYSSLLEILEGNKNE